MAGDTLRGIGKKQIAEALENAGAPEHTTELNGTNGTSHAAADAEARPERSLDELPSERTGYPVNNHSGEHAAPSITNATTLVQDASAATAPEETTTAVDDAAPLTSTSTPRSGPNRVSFGTMIGHEMHAVQARVAAAVAEAEAGLRGTAHGHDVHLPAHPAMAGEPETAVARISSPSLGVPAAHAQPAASAAAANFAPARDSLTDFSGGDRNFFDTAPVNDEYEPENPRGRLYTRLAVSGAVIAVVSVVVVAWINSHGSADEAPPIQARTQPAVSASAPTAAGAPTRPIALPPRAAEVPPTSTIPSSVPERIAVSVPTPAATMPTPRPGKAPAVAAMPPAPTLAPKPPSAKPPSAAARTASIGAPASAPKPVAAAAAPVRELRTPPPPAQKKPTGVAAAAPRAPPAPPATRPAPPPVAKAQRPESAPAHPVAKASPPPRTSKGAARAKQKYDPDGTLPLSFE